MINRTLGYREKDAVAVWAWKEYDWEFYNAFGVGIMEIRRTMPCSHCGKLPAQNHHDDYNYPLRTQRVCRKRHSAIHRTDKVIHR